MRLAAAAFCWLLVSAQTVLAQTPAPVSFSRQIAPLLEEKCGMCHSADARTSDFQIDSLASLLKGGRKAGPAVIPGKPATSPILQYVRGQREPRMPRDREPLTESDIALLESWIQSGARDDTPAVSDTAAAAASAPEPSGQDLLKDALFAESSEQLLILRRGMRLTYVPRPKDPPRIYAGSANPIDQFIAAKWIQAALPEAKRPPKLAGDQVFLRRVYLDIIGAIPTIGEARKFLADASPDKREKLIDELLSRNSDYAANWTPFWEEAIASTDTGIVGGIVRHGDYRQWIFDSFVKNKPYDVMVAELIDPTMPGYQKAEPKKQNGDYTVYPQYVLNSSHLETIQTAANIAQTFLGTEMKCASCHNHFLNREWPQARFLAFAAMFSPHDLEVIRCEQRSGNYVAAKFPFALPGAPSSVPRDITARLHRAATLLTDPADERFSKTIVNRLWKRYLGLGLIEPVDDFRLDRKPANPDLLDWLAYDFMTHGYDLKHTIRVILTSRTYQTQYDARLEDHFDVAKPAEPRYYRSPSLRKLTAEELLDSIRVAATQTLDSRDRLYRQTNSTDLTRALGRPASRNEVSTSRPEDVAVVQALQLLNGDEFYKLVYSAPILQQNPNIERLYWAAFSRPPTVDESRLADGFLKEAGAPDPTGNFGDMLWAMLVSPAFEYIQ